MAINFSASFAACLAARLKVPSQIMYCISQDTGAPYVLYKDSQETASERTVLGGGQWGSDMYQTMQQSPQQAHLTNHHTPQLPTAQQQNLPQTPQSPPNEEAPPPQQSGDQPQQRQQHGVQLPSPAHSPYAQQPNPQTELDEDAAISQVSANSG